MRKSFRSLSRLVVLFLPILVLVAQTEHITPFTGTWKLNVAKSKFNPGPPPKSLSVTWAPDGTYTVDSVGPQGNQSHWSHPWSVDAEVPVTGAGMENATVISTLRGNVMDDTAKRAGRTVQTFHRVVSPDGRTMTVTLEGTDRQGRPMHNEQVFEKQ